MNNTNTNNESRITLFADDVVTYKTMFSTQTAKVIRMFGASAVVVESDVYSTKLKCRGHVVACSKIIAVR